MKTFVTFPEEERKMAKEKSGDIQLLKQIVNLREETFNLGMLVTSLIKDLRVIVWDYLCLDTFSSDELRLVFWHQDTVKNRGEFSILETMTKYSTTIDEKGNLFLGADENCDADADNDKLFSFSTWPLVNGSDLCKCGNPYEIELQFFYADCWHVLWSDSSDSLDAGISLTEINWETAQVGYYRHYKIFNSSPRFAYSEGKITDIFVAEEQNYKNLFVSSLFLRADDLTRVDANNIVLDKKLVTL